MDGPSAYCATCGAPASGERFCTSCGSAMGIVPAMPVREPAYARPRAPVPAPAPPPASAPAPAFPPPLTPAAAPRVIAPAPSPVLPPAVVPAPEPLPWSPPAGGGPGPGLWVGAAAVLLVIVLLGAWLLFHGGSGSPSAGPTPPILPPASDTTSTPTDSAAASGSSPTSQTTASGQVGAAADVAGLARATAPAHAPDGLDFAGDPVTYGASNLVDGALDTCWRVAGDATGTVLRFRLDRPTRLTGVGLVNGYAKTAFSGGRRFDWYAGNRRVLSVDWIFDDGSRVSQSFSRTRAMQSRAIAPVTTSTVRLEITAVSPPGHGAAARDDTAISEVSLLGRPG
jgi:hypothetical protein